MPDPILFGPDSEVYNTYAVVSPAPGNPGAGGSIAFRHVRPLGTQLVLQDGRKFRFAGAGGSSTPLVVGNLLSAGALTASQQDLTPAATVVGDRTISLTTGASSAINVFAEGWAQVSVTPDLGNVYKIAGHATMATAAGDLVHLAPGHSIRVAWTTSTRVNLVDNPYFRVIQSPSDPVVSIPVGVAVAIVNSQRGGWIQTRGVAGVLEDGSVGVIIAGCIVCGGSAVGGAVHPLADDAQDTSPQVGYAIFSSGDTKASPIMLRLDG